MPTPNADGPDISHYQTLTGKPIDPRWTLCSHKATEGRAAFDKKFAARWGWMRQQRFRYRGAYHWLRSDSTMAAQADNLVAVVKRAGGLQRGEFIQADWETTEGIAPVGAGQVIEWCDRVEQAFGRECVIVYTSDWVPWFTQWRERQPKRPLWYANYSASGWAECEAWHADVWQWTSAYRHPSIVTPGDLPGFDMNHVFDFATLDRLTDQTVVTNPEVLPVEYFVRFKGYTNVFHVGAGGAVHVSSAIVDKGKATLGDPIVVDHRETKASICATAGIPEGFLTPSADGK